MRLRPASILVAATAGVLAWHAGADSAELTTHSSQAVVAAAKKPSSKRASARKGLWASINKCDTADAPDTVGVRGSMPGLGKRKTIASMRFRVQFKRPSDGAWIDAGPDATSDWKRLGQVTDAVLESGQDFTFEAPSGGGRHVLRGIVDFRWTKAGEIVRQRSRVTEGGHPSSAGGDPKSYSAATCTIK